MARKKKEETIEEVKIENKTNEDIYTGLLVLDMKLTQLIEIMSNINEYLDKKAKGQLGI